MRLSSSGSEGWYRSVLLVKVRLCRSRISWLFYSQRLSIESFEARPNGRNCILFGWQRCPRVLRTQRQNSWKRIKNPFTDTFVRVYRLVEYSPRKLVTLGQTRTCRFDCPQGEGAVSQTVLSSLKFKETGDDLPIYFRFSQCLVLALKRHPRTARQRHWVAIDRGRDCTCAP